MKRYLSEQLLVVATLLVSVLGFWKIYVGDRAAPTPYHHLHVTTVFAWLFLLLAQLQLLRGRRNGSHRSLGLAVLVVGPLLFAASALLSVHSAHKGLVSGQGDFMIVQNVMATLILGALVLLAFVLRRRRKLHGTLLMGTVVLFLGIATFFTLIGWVPRFRIDGPETFHRFAAAAMVGQGLTLGVGLLYFAKDWRHGWPYLVAGASFFLNEWIRSALRANGLLEPLTRVVGSVPPAIAFAGSFALLLSLLLATGVLDARRRMTKAPERALGGSPVG